jgi:deoxyguanosine kinase
MQRIAMRDRPYERSMEYDYIASLNAAYEDFLDTYLHGVPVLRLDTNELNFVSDPQALEWVDAQIRARLAEAPRQPKLPLEISGS